jgi:hypothetical protein
MPAPMRRERQRLLAGRSRQVGPVAFAGVDDVKPLARIAASSR